MREERRQARRAGIPGMRVVFEGAAGERVAADVLNVGRGGLFIRTAGPLEVGKRLSLEVPAIGGVGTWSALGRVVWTRAMGEAGGAAGGAPGMGVKLIDVDDSVVAAIDRLVNASAQAKREVAPGTAPPRERTVLGLGGAPKPAPTPAGPAAPARERTVMGLGGASAPPAAKPPPREPSVQEPPPEGWDVHDVPAAPDVHGMTTRVVEVPLVPVAALRDEAMPSEAPTRRAQRVPLGAPPASEPVPATNPATSPARAPERSIVIDLVPRAPDVEVAPPARQDEPVGPDAAGPASDEPEEFEPRRHGGRWLLSLVLILGLAAAALYVMRGRLPWVQSLVDRWSPTPPVPAVAPAPTETASTPIPVPIPTASPTVAASFSATRAPTHAPAPSATAAPSPTPTTAPTAVTTAVSTPAPAPTAPAVHAVPTSTSATPSAPVPAPRSSASTAPTTTRSPNDDPY